MLATNLTISPFPHHTISPSHNLCNFREIVDNGVGDGFHETLLQTVAVRNADGHTVGVATHENVEVGVAYDDGVLGLQVVVLQRFQHRLGVGLHVPYKNGFYNVGKFKDAQSLHFAVGYPF